MIRTHTHTHTRRSFIYHTDAFQRLLSSQNVKSRRCLPGMLTGTSGGTSGSKLVSTGNKGVDGHCKWGQDTSQTPSNAEAFCFHIQGLACIVCTCIPQPMAPGCILPGSACRGRPELLYTSAPRTRVYRPPQPDDLHALGTSPCV